MQVRSRRATIADVAKAAGVSKTAVSFAFNTPERLKADTVTRIRDVAASLDYRPDPVARMLARRRTGTIGILTSQSLDEMFLNPYFGAFEAGVASEAETSGYSIQFLSPLHGSLARAAHRASVDGVIAIGLWEGHPEIGEIRRSGLPFVLVDSMALPDDSSVSVDDEGGARSAADHLLALGHRRFGIIAFSPWPKDEEPAATADVAPPAERPRRSGADDLSACRLRGYRLALDAAGVDLPDEVIAYAPSTMEQGFAAFRRLWASGLRPTALLAMSDVLAIGVLRAARELGIGVPDDLSVVGFDDISLAEYVYPPLTTVHQEGQSKGDLAMQLLLRSLETKPSEAPSHRHLETRLIVRASSGPAPG